MSAFRLENGFSSPTTKRENFWCKIFVDFRLFALYPFGMKKNRYAQALVALRNKKLSPERRREIATLAGVASGIARRKNKIKNNP
jgi:hypothetical protein